MSIGTEGERNGGSGQEDGFRGRGEGNAGCQTAGRGKKIGIADLQEEVGTSG